MLKTIYFRGFTDFCNYSCSYCPFAKKTPSHQLKKDEEQLQKLYTWLISKAEETSSEVQKSNKKGDNANTSLSETSPKRFQIMITPYGEGLIHPLYQEYMARFAQLANVDKVGIQTNLSLEAELFLKKLPEDTAHKWYLWATFHSEFADMEIFAKKANLLCEHVNISCGIVANSNNLSDIKHLRALLNPDLYLWINAQDSLRKSFSKELIVEISKIDPLFAYEFYSNRKQDFSSQFQHCSSYENLYIDGGRYSNQCFFKRKQAIAEDCHDHGKCNCYLGYHNFKNNPLSSFFEENRAFRIPYKRKFKAIFADLDGVLIQNGKINAKINNNKHVDKNNDINSNKHGDKNNDINSNINGDDTSLEPTLQYLSSKTKLFLATSRSLHSAKKTLGHLFDYFEGGVFSDGAHIFQKKDDENFEEIIPISKNFSNISDIRSHEKNNFLLRNPLSSKSNLLSDSKPDFAFSSFSTLNSDTHSGSVLRLTLSKSEYQKKSEELIKSLQNMIQAPSEAELKVRTYENRVFLQHPDASKKRGVLKLLDLNGFDSDEILVISDNEQDIELLESFLYSACPVQVKKLAPYCRYHINFNQIPLILE